MPGSACNRSLSPKPMFELCNLRHCEVSRDKGNPWQSYEIGQTSTIKDKYTSNAGRDYRTDFKQETYESRLHKQHSTLRNQNQHDFPPSNSVCQSGVPNNLGASGPRGMTCHETSGASRDVGNRPQRVQNDKSCSTMSHCVLPIVASYLLQICFLLNRVGGISVYLCYYMLKIETLNLRTCRPCTIRITIVKK